MKKILAIITAVGLLAGLLTACGNDTSKQAETSTAAETTTVSEAAVADDAAEAVSEAAEDAANAAEEAVEEASDAVDDAVEAITDAVDEAAENVSDAVDEAVEDGSEAADAVIDEVKDAVEDVTDAVADAVEDAEAAVAEVAEDVTDAVADAVEDAEAAVAEVAEEVTDAVADAVEDAEAAVAEAVEDVTDAVGDAAGVVAAAADEAIDDVKDVAEDASEAVDEVIDEVKEAVAGEEAAQADDEENAEDADAAEADDEKAAEAEEGADDADAVAAEAADDADQAAADEVAALIDAIYVQERTEDTDAQIAAAKAAWDALTDEQKELVEGEEADPDYFGRDTGDASLDDPRNQDEIGDKELLVVSFGTSFNESRAEDIKGVEDALAAAYPDWAVRRAFTAQIIINHVQARDGEVIDNMTQALDRAVANGVKILVVQPTHLMHGAEYDEMCEALDAYADSIETIIIAEPLLGEVGSDATVINEDKKAVAEAVVAEAVAASDYDSLEAAAEDGTAFVFMGHGTAHTAKVSYSQMATQMAELGYENVFVGTVEGEPEETACEVIIEKVKDAGYTKAILRPLMVVAGDHANNDMAGDDEDSWKSMFEAADLEVECQIAGLGRIEAVQDLYVSHTADALVAFAGEDEVTDESAEAPAKSTTAFGMKAAEEEASEGEVALADGIYSAEFDTDSSMFHVNEANDGKGVLTVEDGVMTIHVSLVSKKIVNLFPGTAEDAQKEGAEILEPTLDTVTYSDGMSEEVYGFDIPVPVIGEEFDLANLGESGRWFDHKVSVSDPQPIED